MPEVGFRIAPATAGFAGNLVVQVFCCAVRFCGQQVAKKTRFGRLVRASVRSVTTDAGRAARLSAVQGMV